MLAPSLLERCVQKDGKNNIFEFDIKCISNNDMVCDKWWSFLTL